MPINDFVAQMIANYNNFKEIMNLNSHRHKIKFIN
jgi:hypothetical protein